MKGNDQLTCQVLHLHPLVCLWMIHIQASTILQNQPILSYLRLLLVCLLTTSKAKEKRRNLPAELTQKQNRSISRRSTNNDATTIPTMTPLLMMNRLSAAVTCGSAPANTPLISAWLAGVMHQKQLTYHASRKKAWNLIMLGTRRQRYYEAISLTDDIAQVFIERN